MKTLKMVHVKKKKQKKKLKKIKSLHLLGTTYICLRIFMTQTKNNMCMSLAEGAGVHSMNPIGKDVF